MHLGNYPLLISGRQSRSTFSVIALPLGRGSSLKSNLKSLAEKVRLRHQDYCTFGTKILPGHQIGCTQPQLSPPQSSYQGLSRPHPGQRDRHLSCDSSVGFLPTTDSSSARRPMRAFDCHEGTPSSIWGRCQGQSTLKAWYPG